MKVSVNLFTDLPNSGRPLKGKSIIALPLEYVTVDLETTGYSPAWDEIIEIGAIRIKNGEAIESFQQLINPQMEISSFVSELTGITNEMLEAAPTIDQVLPAFDEFLGNSIIVGQNTGFDINFLYDAYTNILSKPLVQDYVNIMRLSHKLFPEMEHHRLVDIATACNVSGTSFHRALNDCEYTYKCFEIMRGMIQTLQGGEEEFINSFKKKKTRGKINKPNLADLSTEKTEFDETHPLYKKRCVFTGKLSRYTRIEAAQLVLDFGGLCENGVTKKTNYLIMGDYDYYSSIKDGKSNKRKKAEEYIKNGQDLTILSETSFYEMLEE